MREKTFKKFKKGEIDCIVATNVAARGLDFPQIDIVIQMQPPNSTEDYIHRSGRTGRAGKKGVCVSLFSHKEEYLMDKIENETKVLMHKLNQNDLKSSRPRRDAEEKRPYREEKEERKTSGHNSASEDFNY